MLSKVVISVVLILGVSTSVWSLECYSCDSRWQQGCASPFNETLFTPINCTSINELQDTCAVYTATVNNVTYTTRACTSSRAGDACDVYKNVVQALNGSLEECRTCQTDRCNSGNGLKSAVVLVALMFIFRLFI